jgi:hypothetical protein
MAYAPKGVMITWAQPEPEDGMLGTDQTRTEAFSGKVSSRRRTQNRPGRGLVAS